MFRAVLYVPELEDEDSRPDRDCLRQRRVRGPADTSRGGRATQEPSNQVRNRFQWGE